MTFYYTLKFEYNLTFSNVKKIVQILWYRVTPIKVSSWFSGEVAKWKGGEAIYFAPAHPFPR